MSESSMRSQGLEAHYQSGDLLQRIRDGLMRLGVRMDQIGLEDLAPVDEFHIGGRAATEHLFKPLSLDSTHHVLDVGCGLGGTARFLAHHFGCRVTGIDLTHEYVEVGQQLCEWVGLQDNIQLQVGNALDLPWPDASFDAITMLHVGMNIHDKPSLWSSCFRVLKPGGSLLIYDVMKTGADELSFPVPWASHPDQSALSSPESYQQQLQEAGFEPGSALDRRSFALAFFDALKQKMAANGPPPLGLHLLMGETAPQKIHNMIENLQFGRLAPVELRAQKPA